MALAPAPRVLKACGEVPARQPQSRCSCGAISLWGVLPPLSGQLLALVDALHAGTLNDAQRETVQALRTGILSLAGGGNGSKTQAV